MSKTINVIEFTEDLVCTKCGNGETEGDEFRPSFCSSDTCQGPKAAHIHMGCAKCEYTWVMLAANDDIEQEFDDLDKYTDKCPMCRLTKMKIVYCLGPEERRACNLVDLKFDVDREHLHNECEFCDFEWVSEVKDYKPKEAEVKQPA